MRRIRPRTVVWSGLLLSLAGAVLFLRLWPSQVLCPFVLIAEGAEAEPAWSGEGRRLRPGRPVRCELTGNAAEAHRAFKVHLEAGQFLYLTAGQPEIDISVALWSPERKVLLEVDTLPGRDERLFYIAPETGDYGLLISANDEGQSGGYQVSLRVRQPTAMDLRRAEAMGVFSQGERCREAKEYGCAKENYEKALALWQRLGDTTATLETYFQIGSLQADLGKHEQAELLWTEEVLPGWQETPREPPFLNYLGQHAFSERENSQALRFFQGAFKAAHRERQHDQEMRALRGLIDAYRELREIQQGFDTYRTALSLARSERDRSEIFGAMGDFFLAMGDPERSLTFYSASLEWPMDATRRAHLLTWKGMAEFQLGEYKVAGKTLREALSLARTRIVKDAGIAAQALNNLATVYVERYHRQERRQDFLQLAEQYLKEARPLTGQSRDQESEAITISYSGRILDLRGLDAAAVDLYTRAYEQFLRSDFKSGMVGSLHGRARARKDLGQLEAARADIEKVIEILEGERSSQPSGTARAAFVATSTPFYQFQIELLADLHQRDPQAGYAEMAFGKSEAFRARSLLEALVEERRPDDAQSDLLGDIEEIEARLRHVNPLLLLSPEDAMESPLDDLEAETREFLVEWEILRANLRGRTVGESRVQEPVSVREIRDHLDEDTLILAYMAGEEHGYVWSVGLEGVEMYPLPHWREIEKKAAVLAKLLAQSYDKEGGNSWYDTALWLSNHLLAPVAKHLGRRRLIILRDGALYDLPFDVLPDPRRQFDGEPSESAPVLLVESNEVSYAPSGSVLVRILERSHRRQPAPRQLAAFGDAVFGLGDPRVSRPQEARPPAEPSFEGSSRLAQNFRPLEPLPASRKEVNNITDLLPKEMVLKVLGLDAQRERLLESDLKEYRILHIATHSLLDSKFPELSSLVFSMVDKAGQPVNGLLTFYEISNLDLPIDMVVLSACQTASGKEVKGEGVIGLGRAFLHAGASRVVVSLWNVDDKATAFLMERFYEGMFDRNLSPPEALRQARLAVRSRPEWRAPYYWAPFVLEGDWH